jgi:hypothetical protein
MRWPYQVRARGIGAWLDRVDDLSRCARGLAGDGGRIRIVIQRLDTSGSSILASPHSSVVTAAVGVPAMNDRFILASIHARDCADADWRCPWLRINLLVPRDGERLPRPRSAPDPETRADQRHRHA